MAKLRKFLVLSEAAKDLIAKIYLTIMVTAIVAFACFCFGNMLWVTGGWLFLGAGAGFAGMAGFGLWAADRIDRMKFGGRS